MSPYLFIIALELFLIKIRNDPCIKGIKIDNAEVKLAAFADDLTTFLQDKGYLEHLFGTLKAFEGCAGLKLNKDNTEAYWLGSSHNCNESLDIETVNKPMEILGIYFIYNSRLKKNELNFDATLKSLTTARLKYNSIYNDRDFNWKQIYLIPDKVTLDIRTGIFQYKLLNRIVYTNKLLY